MRVKAEKLKFHTLLQSDCNFNFYFIVDSNSCSHVVAHRQLCHDTSAVTTKESSLEKKANISFESSFLHFSSSMQQEETFLTFFAFYGFPNK